VAFNPQLLLVPPALVKQPSLLHFPGGDSILARKTAVQRCVKGMPKLSYLFYSVIMSFVVVSVDEQKLSLTFH
jgi:hypothetical protein